MHPCWECDCTKSSDVPSKCYKTLEVDSQSFVYVDSKAVKVNPKSDHPMFTLPGVTTRMVRGDGLHILFTKGVYAHLLGSILHYMCWYDRVGRPQAKPPCERLAYIFSEVQQQYKRQESRCRLTNLRLSMFTKPKRPHASWASLDAKGAECKRLAPALLPICKACLDKGKPQDQQMITALEAMCSLVELFNAADMFLTASEFERAWSLAKDFLASYSWLNSWAKDAGRSLFHIVVKHHTFQHLVLNARHLDPRCHWSFKNEDFVGQVSKLTHSISMGVSSPKLSSKLMPKYRILFHLLLHRQGMSLAQKEIE